MKWVSILFLVTFSCLTYGQDFEIKQITSGDFDARNPTINNNSFLFNQNKFFFEIHNGSSINIYCATYDAQNNLFSDTIAVTEGSFQNINPVGEASGGVIFQTNQNGNWDIAYRKYENGVFGDIVFLTNSPSDEINPREIFSEPYSFEPGVQIIFERDSSIFSLYADTSQIYEELVFEKTSELSYQQSAGVFLFGAFPPQQGGLHVAAIQKDQNGNKGIVSRHRNENGTWDQINIVVDTCLCSNPVFQPVEYYTGLVYEEETDTNKILVTITDWQITKTPITLLASPEGDCSSFRSAIPNLITEPQNGRLILEFYYPHSYLISNGPNNKIRLNYYESSDPTLDSIYTLKINKSNIDLGRFGFFLNYEVFYTIFEDSVDGYIHLFGRRFLNPLGDVNDENPLNDFSLYQNFPNPFNPTTKISWLSAIGSWQTLKVYDVLGNEVAKLVNEYRPAGSYEVEFDASKLSGGVSASGVYFYRLQAGDFVVTRKMVFMK